MVHVVETLLEHFNSIVLLGRFNRYFHLVQELFQPFLVDSLLDQVPENFHYIVEVSLALVL